ncbi:MAG TPA: type II secretion system F family protein [Stellaceae bacterium]|nr:type II secretion system F family protein [Stellaceae bacterium]
MIALVNLLIALCIGALAGGAEALRAHFARRAAINGRLALVATGAEPRLSHGPASGLFERGFDRTLPLVQRLLAPDVGRRWGATVSPLTMVAGGLLGGVSVWFLTHAVLKSPLWLAMSLTAVAVAAAPRILLAFEQRKMEQLFLERFPDAVDMVVRALRAGIPLTAAVRAVGKEAPPPVDAVFAGLADQTEIGVPLDEALAKAATWISLPDFRFFAVAVALQYATGGNLAATLESLSEIIRKRRIMRLKAKAVTAEVRLSTYILSALPFLVVGGLLVISPGYLKPLLADPRGNWILGGAIGGLLTGLVVMRNMMNSVSSE